LAETVADAYKDKMYQESFWILALRKLAGVFCVVGIIAGIAVALRVATIVNAGGWPGLALIVFLLVLIMSVLSTFIVTLVIMIFLDMATDASVTAQSNLKILEELQAMNRDEQAGAPNNE